MQIHVLKYYYVNTHEIHMHSTLSMHKTIKVLVIMLANLCRRHNLTEL